MKASRAFGALLIASAFLLFFGQSGLTIEYRPPFSYVSAGEFNLWRAHTMLILPGSALLFWSSQTKLGQLLDNLVRKLSKSLALLIFLLVAALYRLARLFFLRDLPVTDEEYTGQLGGRLLATGRVLHDFDLPYAQMPTLYLFERDGAWGSFDFLGIQLAWLISELTFTGPWIFCLVSAATVATFYHLLMEVVRDHKWSIIGTGLLAISPMFTFLSMTTHAHVLSRFFLASLLLSIFRSLRTEDPKWAMIAGFCFGAGILSRPAETLLLSFPFLCWFGSACWKASLRTHFFAFVIGGIPCACTLFLHNHIITGSWWLLPRMAPNSYPSPDTGIDALKFLETPSVLIRRVADNLINNVSFTFLYWHGLVGLVLFVFGAKLKTTRLFTMGLVLHALSALFHDNDGVRVVGPIHYSEWVIPLTVVATLGLFQLHKLLTDMKLKSGLFRSIAAMLFVGAIFSTIVIGLSLRSSNSWHYYFFEFVEGSVPSGSVVLAPRNAYFWAALPPGSYNRSWVFETRAPTVDMSDDILLLRYTSDSEDDVLARFPERAVFLATPSQVAPYISVVDLRSGAIPAEF